jgi:hypothetical protein
MTHDEIISIYKEVSNKICNGTEWCWVGAGEPLKLFANLVAAKEREACAKFFDDNDTNIFWGSEAARFIRARGEQA